MAAPSPHWKRKTRPCPFYSQGRCLFADSCNFIHTVKINNEPAVQAFELADTSLAGESQYDAEYVGSHKEGGNVVGQRRSSEMGHQRRSSSQSIQGKRRSMKSPPRSPRLSGLLFALQSVIGPDVEEEEEGNDEEDFIHEGEEDNIVADQSSSSSLASYYTSNAQAGPSYYAGAAEQSSSNALESHYPSNALAGPSRHAETAFTSPVAGSSNDLPVLDLHEATFITNSMTDDFSPPLSAALDGSFNLTSENTGFSFLSDFPTPPVSLPSQDMAPATSTPKRAASLRHRIPPPIITRHLEVEVGSAVLDDDTLESRPLSGHLTPTHSATSSRRQSTFDLLSSPFASPAKRILSPQLFPVREPLSPMKFSPNPIPGTLSQEGGHYADDDLESLARLDSPTGSLAGFSQEELTGSVSDYSRTPRNAPHWGNLMTTELEDMPPLPPSRSEDGGSHVPSPGSSMLRENPEEEFTITAISQADASSYDYSYPSDDTSFSTSESSDLFDRGNDRAPLLQFLSENERELDEDESFSHASGSPFSPTVRLGKVIPGDEHGSLQSELICYSSDPSPVSTDLHSSATSETLVDSPIFTPSQKKRLSARRIASLSLISPTKVIRDSSCPPALEKTVKPTPSPLSEDPPRSASSMSSRSSSKLSWVEVSRKAFGSQKVPFGFRQSPAIDKSHSSQRRTQGSHTSRESNISRPRLSISTRLQRSAQLESIRSASPFDPSDTFSQPPNWMRPLRLSHANTPISPRSQLSSYLFPNNSSSSVSATSFASHLRTVSKDSNVDINSLSSARSSLLSAYVQEATTSYDESSHERIIQMHQMQSMESGLEQSSPVPAGHGPETQSDPSDNHRGALDLDLLSPLSGSMRGFDFDNITSASNQDECVVFRAPSAPPYAPSERQTLSVASAPAHAVATPRPTLLFAIASDDVAEVERVLASGEIKPNDDVGPQSALEFALTNNNLVHKTEIVKTLLAYGADASVLPADLRGEEVLSSKHEITMEDSIEGHSGLERKRESMNPAMKYYLNRANAPQSAQTAAVRKSFFRPLTRIRFDLVGQDRALEHLYWVLSMHSQQHMVNPLVVLCCGPSGHGKSLLARKFGSLLDVPTHTVNMTILQSSHDLWQCPSMSPYDQPSNRTLAEFLTENEGKRCVVVLDELDKNEDERNLWSLLAPWELGRCSVDAGRRHIDVRNVIWLGTTNIGQNLIFEYHESRKEPEGPMTKAEYRELMSLLRPRVSAKIGTSLMSRVTTVLPFVPFTAEEKLAIASEVLLSLGGETALGFTPEEFERVAAQSVAEYVSSEGARSLYRNVSTHLMEAA